MARMCAHGNTMITTNDSRHRYAVTEHGRVCVCAETHSLDLVKEYEELKMQIEVGIEVGKEYLTRDGRRVKILHRLDIGPTLPTNFPYVGVIKSNNNGEEVGYWGSDGLYDRGITHMRDLVSEYVAPWEPVMGERFYVIKVYNSRLEVDAYLYEDDEFDQAFIKDNNFFRTHEEAEQALGKVLDVLKELKA